MITTLKNVKTKMTRKQIKTFLNKVLTNKKTPYSIELFTDKSKKAFGAWITVAEDNKSFTLEVNTELKSDIRCLLLHEIGHLESINNHSHSKVERELQAQLWGINKAKELGWHNIEKEMKWHLRERWTCNFNESFKWNSPYRVYILASKRARKEGLV